MLRLHFYFDLVFGELTRISIPGIQFEHVSTTVRTCPYQYLHNSIIVIPGPANEQKKKRLFWSMTMFLTS